MLDNEWIQRWRRRERKEKESLHARGVIEAKRKRENRWNEKWRKRVFGLFGSLLLLFFFSLSLALLMHKRRSRKMVSDVSSKRFGVLRNQVIQKADSDGDRRHNTHYRNSLYAVFSSLVCLCVSKWEEQDHKHRDRRNRSSMEVVSYVFKLNPHKTDGAAATLHIQYMQ